eukprot:TRINITY_DN1622_c0_g2_i1.p1 TRINITY_DN1622_c0_g2~~TRINITY_DN1622_c0_g2_i1.p1  ORF type:complete len:897 (+),score=163.59 TRINITY_DN1622_c0_g2_i1:170-2860(+)
MSLENWKKLQECPLNPGLFGHSVSESNGILYMFGGSDRNGVFSNIVFSYSIHTGEWESWECTGTAPCPRNFHSSCIVKDRLFVFGGKSNGYHSDLHYLDLSSRVWKVAKVKTKSPLARYGHCLFEYGGDLYVMGGYDQHGFCCDRLFQFSIGSGIWKTVDYQTPTGAKLNSGRYHHTCTVYQNKLLVFGGKGPDSVLGDLLEFSFEARTWRVLSAGDPQGPAPRWGHSSVLVGNTLYIYGGRDNVLQFSDMYSFDLKSKKWNVIASSPNNAAAPGSSMSVSAPQHRYFHGAALHGNAIYFVWGKNIYDFCFADILQYVIGPSDAIVGATSGSSSSGALGAAASSSSSGTPMSPLMGKKIRLKCQFNEELRMMSVMDNIDYGELTAKLSSEYGSEALRIQYEDDEGDLITIRSSADLEEAFSYFSSTNRTTVKIFLSVATPSAPGSSHGSIDASDGSVGKRSSLTSPKQQRPIRWQPGGLIGEGGFGKVYMGMNLDTGELMAVKQVALSESALNKQQVDALQREIDVMHELHHENIVQYLGSEFKDNKLNIFLEYQPGGSIATLLQRFNRLNEKIVRSFTRQILNGLDYLHSHGIAHRDIKGANILVDLNGHVKLADFGASKKLADIASFSEGCKTVTGSPYWMAPEVIQQGYGGASYGRKADIWSLGAVIIEMVTGKPPFHALAPVTALFKIGSSPAVPPVPPDSSAHLADFLKLCFQRDPKNRPSASELLRHSFIVGDEAAAPPLNIAAAAASTTDDQAAAILSSSPRKKKSSSKDKDKDKDKAVRTKKRRSKQLKTSQVIESLNAAKISSSQPDIRKSSDSQSSASASSIQLVDDHSDTTPILAEPSSSTNIPTQGEFFNQGSSLLDDSSDINSIINFLRERVRPENQESLVSM